LHFCFILQDGVLDRRIDGATDFGVTQSFRLALEYIFSEWLGSELAQS
jgi:hypothetical protein